MVNMNILPLYSNNICSVWLKKFKFTISHFLNYFNRNSDFVGLNSVGMNEKRHSELCSNETEKKLVTIFCYISLSIPQFAVSNEVCQHRLSIKVLT